MEILNCSLTDVDTVLKLHEAARDLQKKKNTVIWPVFERALIEKDITESRLWKLMLDDQMACNWAITFTDREIWGELERDNSIYLHRIVTDPSVRASVLLMLL
jgi:hypothetical protein